MNSSDVKKEIVIVAGPTSTGKTSFGIEYAHDHNGVIINADSVQIYRYLNIGANKGNLTPLKTIKFESGDEITMFDIEHSGVEGVGFDMLDPDEYFSVADFQKICVGLCEQIWSWGKLPILVGGTGLYIDAIVKRTVFEPFAPDFKLREKLRAMSVGQMQDLLVDQNPVLYNSLNSADRQNPARLIRLIEKSSNSEKIQTPNNLNMNYEIEFFYPKFDRSELYTKIDLRVDWMFANGLVDEVKNILDMGYSSDSKGLRATGYKQVVEYLVGSNFDLNQCIEAVKQAHRNYAKRQITWFEGKARGYDLSSRF